MSFSRSLSVNDVGNRYRLTRGGGGGEELRRGGGVEEPLLTDVDGGEELC